MRKGEEITYLKEYCAEYEIVMIVLLRLLFTDLTPFSLVNNYQAFGVTLCLQQSQLRTPKSDIYRLHIVTSKRTTLVQISTCHVILVIVVGSF
jgi:hypothetical protein